MKRLPVTDVDPALLGEPEELKLLKNIAAFPGMIESSALELAPHRVFFFMMELAGMFHSYYNKHKVLTDDTGLTQARLYLVDALRIVFRNGLQIVGLSAPEKM